VVGNNPLSYTDPSGTIEAAGAGAEIGGAIAGPVGATIGGIIGGLVDLGALFYGLFGGGGSPPPPNWANVQQTTVSDNNPWSEQLPLGVQMGGGFNPGGLFGSGNTDPYIFSLQAGGPNSGVTLLQSVTSAIGTFFGPMEFRGAKKLPVNCLFPPVL
jgi:hypothetical protein